VVFKLCKAKIPGNSRLPCAASPEATKDETEVDLHDNVVYYGKNSEQAVSFAAGRKVTVARVEIELDEQALEQARRLAEARSCTVEQLIKELIEDLTAAKTKDDVFLGMFAQEADLVDQVMESAMRAREAHPLRQSGG
jgi:hypothetical protein